ncbi:ATP-grasp domain-containing protein [Ruminococcus albus]|uniref:ATP-grasp domain-containing protein n=1 Tax=Ruminococcus albus TaxID=1264 RepID=A0A1H7NIH4_RUMAL|nr:ATP-grasp domain-containing protein [Ruminococcus albus]SEL23360.1 ATP-grasp domain-containing protein [Ruminococcus albus]
MKNGKRVIWFNHWFSQAYNFIELLRRDERNYIIATAKKPDFVFGAAADERYIEPNGVNGEQYVEWALGFCKEHSVDVFFPKRWRAAVISHMDEFAAIGTRVTADGNTEQNDMLDSKMKSCIFMRENDLCATPYMERITTVEGFERAYAAVKEKYGREHKVCVKADRDEGGITYRRLFDDDAPKSMPEDISYQSYLADLKNRSRIYPTVVMPYLSEPEISIDCMRTESGLIAVPRCKIDSHITALRFDKEFIDTAKRISEKAIIDYPYNIQLRPLNGEHVFMEINTRMAGGCYKADAVGVNFPQLSVSHAFGDKIDTEAILSGLHDVRVGEVAGFIVMP